ncbi:MAG TPA: hypothetical protein VFD82_04225 [Planctomycetota bacterium]|nr:hypothetical protein [Planctomycetota bacterium]
MNTLSMAFPTRPTMAGSATVICLLSLCVVMSFGTATLSMLLAKRSVVKRAIEVDEAFMAAEAAVDLAMSELLNHSDFAGDGIGVVSGSAGRASFTATLVPPFTGPRVYTILATGSVGSISRNVEVDVEPGTAGRPGFVGLDSISMSGGVVDTYDSHSGTYASQVAGSALRAGIVHLQSNGNISLSASAMVHGDATPGPGKSVSGATGVTGSTAPATSAIAVDAYAYAPPVDTMGPVSSSITLDSGKHRYTSFVIGSGKVATITGDVELWVDGKFEISGSGTAILDPGARLTIHHGTDKFTISGAGFVNQDRKPANLTVYSATTFAVTCSSGAEFFGTIEAPKAPFTASGMGIYGSVVAKTMTLGGATSLHYDNALGAGTGAYRRRLIWPSGGTPRGS